MDGKPRLTRDGNIDILITIDITLIRCSRVYVNTNIMFGNVEGSWLSWYTGGAPIILWDRFNFLCSKSILKGLISDKVLC